MAASPSEVFLALVNGVAEGRFDELPDLYAEQTDVSHPFDPLRAKPMRTRDELREHFTLPDGTPWRRRTVENVTIHQTTDPEVVVAEFEYHGTTDDGEPYALPGIFVLRVRDGEIVSSRDYFPGLTHTTSARVRSADPAQQR
jgi:ketosteroid isomerase-like protein